MLTALIITIFLPLVAAFVLPFGDSAWRKKAGWLLPLLPFTCFCLIAWLAFQTAGTSRVILEASWVPSLSINLSFLVDGLSLFFGLIITGIGTLIFHYARAYFEGAGQEVRVGRFYGCLALFMAAMLGTVFSNNLISLFVFWELTGIASFLLIGFSNEKKESRHGARMALLITGLTGLFMLVGFILLGQAGGTWQIDQLLDKIPTTLISPAYLNAAMILILLGALGKSAQFPFHFWLPNAMAAPTPVSAYLHSATMVKLGIFLCARMFPALNQAELWLPILTFICFGTMLLCAVLALCSHDLKAILAYSTVSQLGFLMGLYGIGSVIGVRLDFLHIASHACYKACLFMIVGIIDHSCHIRDIRRLGGLWQGNRALAMACLIAAASMAGIPGTLGFISKELVMADLLRIWDAQIPYAPILLSFILLASAIKVAFSARLFFHLFTGKRPSELGHRWHAPSTAILLAPCLLAALIVITGCVPFLLEAPLNALLVKGVHYGVIDNLHIWHGFTAELGISLLVVLAGAGIYFAAEKLGWRLSIPLWFRFDLGFEYLILAFNKGAKKLTAALGSDRPMDYLPIILGFFILIVGWFLQPLAAGVLEKASRNPEIDILRALTAVLIAVFACGPLYLKRWTHQLLSLSAAGFLITFYFLLYRAPDLAMTQILVESAMLIMILLLLSRFPKSAQSGERDDHLRGPRKLICAAIACASGFGITLFILASQNFKNKTNIGNAFLEQTLPLAKGTNAVNTILVDFRGFDTLGEIAVLLIAVLGAIGLVMRYKRNGGQTSESSLRPSSVGLEHKNGEGL